MAIASVTPKYFLGAQITNPKVLASKVEEILDVVNGLQDGSEDASVNDLTVAGNTAITGTLGITGLVTASAGISQGSSNVVEFTVLTTLTATEIVGTAAGDIGHASGATLVAAPSSDYALEFVSATLIYDRATASYGGGADDLVIAIGSGGAAFTSAITDANLLTAAGDKVLTIKSISTELPLTVGTAISLRGTAYTNPGTAAGVLRVYTTYRKILTGL